MRPRVAPLRQWRVTVVLLVPADDPQDEDEVVTSEAVVNSETAQRALRMLVLTSTDNARVTRIDVQLLPDDAT